MKKILNVKLFLIMLLFGSSWIIQQVAYTSCIIFPLEFTCFKNSWYSEKFINDASFSLEYINKSFWVYKEIYQKQNMSKILIGLRLGL